MLLGQGNGRRRGQRNAFVGRPEDDVEIDATVGNRRSVELSKLSQGLTAIEQTGIEEVGAGSPGLERELTEAQYPTLDGKTDELALVRLHVGKAPKTAV